MTWEQTRLREIKEENPSWQKTLNKMIRDPRPVDILDEIRHSKTYKSYEGQLSDEDRLLLTLEAYTRYISRVYSMKHYGVDIDVDPEKYDDDMFVWKPSSQSAYFEEFTEELRRVARNDA